MWTERKTFLSLEHFWALEFGFYLRWCQRCSVMQAAATKAPALFLVLLLFSVSMVANQGRLSKSKAEWSLICRIPELRTSGIAEGGFRGTAADLRLDSTYP